jgi:hypothetical protein
MAEAESRPHRIELDLGEGEQRPSRLWMVVWTLCGMSLLGAACLCGVGLYFFRPAFSHDPEHVADVTRELVQIELAEKWEPGGTIEWNVLWMMMFRGAYYEWKEAQGQLAIVAVDGGVLEQEDVRRHLVRQLQEAGGTVTLAVDREEVKAIMIDGEAVPFLFQQGTESATNLPIRLVEGVVDSSEGPILIALRMNQALWDEQQVLHMLSTLKPQ